MRRLLAVTSLAGLLYADSTIQGPRLGYVPSPAGVRAGVRKVLGILGAARLSDPVGAELRDAVVLPGSDVLFGRVDGELTRLDLNEGSRKPLAIAGVEKLAASPGGEAVLALTADTAFLFSKSGERLADYSLSAAPRLFAVADQGKLAAVTVEESGGEALYVLSELGVRRILRAERFASLAFVPASGDLVVAEQTGLIRRIKQDLDVTEIATVAETKALAVTADGRLLAIAGRTIYAVAFAGGETTTVECACESTLARPLGNSNFALTTGDDGPIWVLDASRPELRVAFIPEVVNE